MFKTELKKDREMGVRKQVAKIMKVTEESPNDRYVEIRNGDSLSLYAKKYYGSDKLWRIIASANKLTTNYPAIGTTIRIPSNPEIEYVEE